MLLLSRADQRSFTRGRRNASPRAEKRGLTIETPGDVTSSINSHAFLLQMSTNLVHTAIVRNLPEQGTVLVTTIVRPRLRCSGVENTGGKLAPDLVSIPVKPFSAAPKEYAPMTQASASAWRSSKASPKHTTSPPFDLVAASREITIRDLLTQAAGLMTVGGIGAQQAAKTTPKLPTDTLASYVPKLAQVPLDFQPGARWSYSALAGPEVLGRIVEIASGQTYDQFLERRLFDPLGMTDTFFYVPEDRRSRLVTLYETGQNGLRQRDERVSTSSGVFFGAGAGLMSTANDYARFAQMLLNGGTFNGRRLLSPATVQLMASNQVGDMYAGNADRPAPGMGYGLLFGVVEDPIAAGVQVSAGSFGWGGTFGTHVRIDPNQKLVSILMIQTVPVALQLQRDFEAAVMDAIVK